MYSEVSLVSRTSRLYLPVIIFLFVWELSAWVSSCACSEAVVPKVLVASSYESPRVVAQGLLSRSTSPARHRIRRKLCGVRLWKSSSSKSPLKALQRCRLVVFVLYTQVGLFTTVRSCFELSSRAQTLVIFVAGQSSSWFACRSFRPTAYNKQMLFGR